MMATRRRCGFVVMLLATLSVVAPGAWAESAPAWPQVQMPPGASSGWVAREMTFNGVPLRVRAFSVTDPVDRVIAFYVRRWRIEGFGDLVGPERQGDWSTVMRVGRNFSVSVRVRQIATGAEGVVVMSPSVENWAPERRVDLPLPAGVHVVQTQEYRQHGRRGNSVILSGRLSALAETDRLVSRLADRGWQVSQRRRSGTRPGAQVAHLQRRKEFLQIVAQRDEGRTLMLINRYRR